MASVNYGVAEAIRRSRYIRPEAGRPERKEKRGHQKDRYRRPPRGKPPRRPR